jgi:hypothetical protein
MLGSTKIELPSCLEKPKEFEGSQSFEGKLIMANLSPIIIFENKFIYLGFSFTELFLFEIIIFLDNELFLDSTLLHLFLNIHFIIGYL